MTLSTECISCGILRNFKLPDDSGFINYIAIIIFIIKYNDTLKLFSIIFVDMFWNLQNLFD